jgi:carboxypeptidase Q
MFTLFVARDGDLPFRSPGATGKRCYRGLAMRTFQGACWYGVMLVACANRGAFEPSVEPEMPAAIRQLQSAPSEATALATDLCDVTGARSAGSEGDARAVDWAVERMKALGLSNVHAEPVTVPHWVRGVDEAEVTSPLRPLKVAALGASAATGPQGVEGVVQEIESLDALKALPAGAATGALLFVNVVMRRTDDGAGYGEAVAVRRLAGAAAEKTGALGVLIRSVGTDSTRFPHTGSQAVPAKVPAVALLIPDAEWLHRLVKKGPVRLRLRVGGRVEAPVQSANVVGELVGRERPDEVVLLAAHLDSWDLGVGALDDAAGVGVVLDVVRLLKALPHPLRRTVRVVLFANEEDGLSGAQAYAKAHADELDRHVLSLEADSGADSARAVRVLADGKAQARVGKWADWFAPLGVVIEAGDAAGGADTSLLRAAGVPQMDVRQNVSRYFDIHHTANDTVDKIDPVQLAQVARTFATVTWLVAEEERPFGRVPQEKRTRKR